MNEQPSQNGANGGRDPDTGRFLAGNRGGPGNPHGQAVAALRSALLAEITEGDVRQVVRRLIQDAIGGATIAAREVLDRALGRPLASVDLSVSGGLSGSLRMLHEKSDEELDAIIDAAGEDDEARRRGRES